MSMFCVLRWAALVLLFCNVLVILSIYCFAGMYQSAPDSGAYSGLVYNILLHANSDADTYWSICERLKQNYESCDIIMRLYFEVYTKR